MLYLRPLYIPESGGGFFYLMCTGNILAIPSSKGFDERYVVLDDASFFETSGPLAADSHAEAASLRELFRRRAWVLRVAYTASVGPRSIEAIAGQARDVLYVVKRQPLRIKRRLFSSTNYVNRTPSV